MRAADLKSENCALAYTQGYILGDAIASRNHAFFKGLWDIGQGENLKVSIYSVFNKDGVKSSPL